MQCFSNIYRNSLFLFRIYVFCSIVGILFFISCVPRQQQKLDVHSNEIRTQTLSYPYRIVTTTAMISDVVKNIVRDRAEVRQIIPNGIDPHIYIPSRTDIVNIAQADIIIYNGLLLEGSLNNALVRLVDKKNIISMAELIENAQFFVTQHNKTDPHIWMNVLLWNQAVEKLGSVFARFDPKNSSYYFENQRKYTDILRELHMYIYNMLQSIPEESRILITSHDAFQYFSEGYDFTVYGIQGISTTSEASLRYINFLVSLIIKKDVAAVFVETSISPKYVQVLIEGVASNGKHIQNGGYLYADAMGDKNTYAGSYIGMMDTNARTITQALHGTVPDTLFIEYLQQQSEIGEE